MLCTIILLVGRFVHFHARDALCRHCQRACGLGNGVVRIPRAFIQLVGERVNAAAHQSLAAGEGVGRAFAIYPTVFRLKRGFAVDQFRAVIGLAQIGGLQRHCTLGDPQRSVNPRNIFKRCCRGAGIFVHYFFCARYFVSGYAGICLCAGHFDIIVQFESNSVCGVPAIRFFGQYCPRIGNGVSRSGQCLTVVDLRAARGFYFKLFRICLCPISVERGRYRDGKAAYRGSLILIVVIPAVESILIRSYR